MSRLMEQITRTPILPHSLAFWGFGQMGVGVKTPKTMLYIDLCLTGELIGESESKWVRGYPPPVAPEQVTNADYYLITHEHGDHLDTDTVGPISQNAPQTKFVAPGWCTDILLGLGIAAERIITPKALEPVQLPGSDVRLTAVPSAHYEKTYDAEKGYRWIGYLIEANGVTFYHAGDTIIYPDYIETLKALPTPDVTMLPVNGRDYYRETEMDATGNLLPAEAVRLAKDLGWDTLIVGHNDLYPYNTIPYSSIADALEKIAPRQKYKVLQPGELMYFVKG